MKETYIECQVLAQKIFEFKERNELTYQKIGDALGKMTYLNELASHQHLQSRITSIGHTAYPMSPSSPLIPVRKILRKMKSINGP